MKKQTHASPRSRKNAPKTPATPAKSTLAEEIAAAKKAYEARAMAEFRTQLAKKKVPDDEEILGSWNVGYYFKNAHKDMLAEVQQDQTIYKAQAAYAKKYKAELKKILLKFYQTAPTPAELMEAAKDIVQSNVVGQAVSELEQELKDAAKRKILELIKS